MTFVHPWAMFAGVLLAGLPVAVHFLTRPRPVAHPLSTLRFVRELLKQCSARSRLRDALVLACRTLMVLAVAAAIARPRFDGDVVSSADNPGEVRRVVVLDVSQSMGARDGGVQLLDRARAKANEFLRYQPGLRANVLLAGAAPQPVFEQLSTNFDSLQAAVRDAQVGPQRLELRPTLEAAAKLLQAKAPGSDTRRELVLVSDFQRRNWGAVDFSVVPADVRIELVATASSATLPNVAIVRAECPGRAVVGRTAQWEVDIANGTPNPREVGVDIAVGETAYHLQGRCLPQRVTTLSGEFLPTAPGWLWGQACLTGNDDALATDDQRACAVQVRRQPTYALITRQAESQRTSSSYLLECALAPDAALKERAAAKVLRISPQSLDRETLAPAEVIALDHPGKIDDVGLRLLANLMRRGKTILYVTAEPVDAVNLKLMSDVVARAWQLPVEFAAPVGGQSRRAMFLQTFRRESPAFKIFGEQTDAAIGGLRFSGGLVSRKLETGLSDDVLASYADGSAAIALSGVEAGSLLVLNADLAESNLSASGVFLPLLEELLQQSLNRRRMSTSLASGERLDIQLPTEVGTAAGLQITSGESNDSPIDGRWGRLADDGAGVRWSSTAAPAPGVYRVCRGNETVFALATGVHSDESQLEYLSPDVLTNRLAAGRNVHYQSTTETEPDADRWWAWLCAIGLGCALAELGLHLIFRS